MTTATDPLLQPFQLKHLSLKNRLMMTAHEPAYPEDGMPKALYRPLLAMQTVASSCFASAMPSNHAIPMRPSTMPCGWSRTFDPDGAGSTMIQPGGSLTFTLKTEANMNDIFQSARSDRPDKENFLVIHTHSLDWQDSGIGGFEHKILYRDDTGAIETMLIKMAPGAFSDYHAHDRREQLYVIEGDFYDQNHRYTAGDFIVREPEANHIAGSDEGALILLIFSR